MYLLHIEIGVRAEQLLWEMVRLWLWLLLLLLLRMLWLWLWLWLWQGGVSSWIDRFVRKSRRRAGWLRVLDLEGLFGWLWQQMLLRALLLRQR